MILNKILGTLKNIPSPREASNTTLAVTTPYDFDSKTTSLPQIDRRQIEDRRLQERRITYCQPYLDTRKNHGRRRSFGRRLDDQVSALPF